MVFKFNLKKFLISILIPLLTGGLSALITKNNMDLYSQINTPPLSPPSWLFPVAWTILYFLMGISLYLVWNGENPNDKNLFSVFGIQLFFNFIWPIIFFNFRAYLTAFVVLIFLWMSSLLMIVLFYRNKKISAFLQIPYILWLTFAAYLNFGVYVLN